MTKLIYMVCVLLFTTITIFAQQDGDVISIGKYRTLQSKILGENRTLLISLPDNYDVSQISYPVLFVLYGDQVKGYFAEAVNIVDRLGGAGEIPPLIVVGVANVDRYRDCLPLQQGGKTGGADKFLRFFTEELSPFVKRNYRTKPFNILAGPQAGAAFGLYVILEKSDLFGAFILTNPFWHEETRSYFLDRTTNFLRTEPAARKFLYISYWDKEGWQDHRPAVEALKKFTELFKQRKSNDNVLNLNYLPENKDFVPPIGIKEGLRKFFENYNPANYSELNTLQKIERYYNELSKEYGFDVDIPEMLLVRKSDDLQNSSNFTEVRNILQYLLQKDSNSLNALSRMGNLNRLLGDYDGAIDYYNKFLTIQNEPFFERQVGSLVKFKEESAVYILEPILNSKTIEAMWQKYSEMKNDSKNTRKFDEGEFNSWGYRLLQRGEMNKAIAVFTLNIELSPKSANVYDSLGEAYMKAGNIQLAIENYKKSLALNPNNENAKKMIEQLQK